MKQIFMINLIAIAMCLFSCSNSKKQTNADPSAVQAEVEEMCIRDRNGIVLFYTRNSDGLGYSQYHHHHERENRGG